MTKRPYDELLTALRKGGYLWKHGRHGKPKVHYFHLTDNDTKLTWMSKDTRNRSVDLDAVKEVVYGQTTDVFSRYPEPARASLSFSLIYKHSSSLRTLDLTCEAAYDFELWYQGIQAVVEHIKSPKPAVPAPLTSANLATKSAPVPPPGLAVQGKPSMITPPAVKISGSAPIKVVGGGQVAGRVSGVVGLPVVEHIPGDCYLWGASEACGPGKVPGEPGVKGWQHSTAPVLVNDTTHLDVSEVAVGLKHAALITHAGEMFTWGDGASGKLGRGNQTPSQAPERVHTLWGKAVRHIDCSDGITAAITQDGALFTWGDGAVGNLGYASAVRQYIPRQVEGPLRDYKITQVSVGPYHSAAVSSSGKLFTWGDGLCGKLGHGNAESCNEPRQVMGLSEKKVINVVCGVWHTAAIAQEREASTTIPSSLAFLDFYSDGDALAEAEDNGENEEGGMLFTWGGEFTYVEHIKDKKGQVTQKKDNNKGCLGHGDSEGRLLPTRVLGEFEVAKARQVAAGLNLTVVVSVEGKVFQMGETGVAGKAKWEGAKLPEQVNIGGFVAHSVACGMRHAAALATPPNRKALKPQGPAPSVVLTWGQGSEGQLGIGATQDSVQPRVVEELRGRTILQVACGGYHTMAVCQHDVREAEAAGGARGNVKDKMQEWFKPKAAPAPAPAPEPANGAEGPGRDPRLHRQISNTDMAVVAYSASETSSSSRSRSAVPAAPAGAAGARGPTIWQFARTAMAVKSANAAKVPARDKQRRYTDLGAPEVAGVRVVGSSGSTPGRPAPVPTSRRITAPDSAHGGPGRSTSMNSERQLHRGISSNSLATSDDGTSETSGADMYQREDSRTSATHSAVTDDNSTQGEGEGRDRYVKQLEGRVEKLQEQLQREMRRSIDVGSGRSPWTGAAAAGGAAIGAAAVGTAAIATSRAAVTTTTPEAIAEDADAEEEEEEAAPAASEREQLERERGEVARMRRELEARMAEVQRRQGAPAAASSGLHSPTNASRFARGHATDAKPPVAGSPAAAEAAEVLERTEQVEEGIYLTFERRPGGQNQLTRIRFSRTHYSKEKAETWWQQHKYEIAQRYNLMSVTPSARGSSMPSSGAQFRSVGCALI